MSRSYLLIAIAGLVGLSACTNSSQTKTCFVVGNPTKQSSQVCRPNTTSQTDQTTPPDAATTAAPGTTSPPLPTYLSADDMMLAAKADWVTTRTTTGDGLTSDVGLSNDLPVAMSLSNTDGMLTFWHFVQGGWHQAESTKFPNWTDPNLGIGGVDSLTFADADGDGSDEAVVNYTANHQFGSVYLQNGAGWHLAFDGTGLTYKNRSLMGSDNLCMPACSDGNYANFYLVRSGDRLEPQYVDRVGDPITLYRTDKCFNWVNDVAGDLRFCMNGNHVKELQRTLQAIGFLYDAGGSGTDGFFGADTETSVRMFQLAHSLPVTGEATGEDFYRVLDQAAHGG